MKRIFSIERYEQSLRHMGVVLPKPQTEKAFLVTNYDVQDGSLGDYNMVGIMIIHSLVHKGVI